MQRRTHPAVRMARIAGGGTLVVAGLVGLVVPIVPGWLLIIPGLSLWSSEFLWAGQLRRRVEAQLRRPSPAEDPSERLPAA